ncbi:MAG: hypothetical protein NTX75_02730 [Proteobacteria bacterium]|nr:hypothetical protein [Pseudomonadota bacterium]
MKKALMFVLAIIISVAFVTTVFAQAPAAAPDKPAAEKAAPVKADKPAKAKAMKATGEVVKISEEEGIVVVKGKDGDVIYDIKDVKWKAYKNAKEVKAGEIVVISYIDKDGKKVAKVISKSVKKDKKAAAPKAEDKPAAASAPTPAAAPTPAPAPAPAKK